MKLYLDENISPMLASVLRGRGYNAISAHEVGMRGKRDEEQLEYAVSQRRVLLTFNARHFAPLAEKYFKEGREHYGIVVTKTLDFSLLIRLTLNLLRKATAEELQNSFAWLESYR
ncbi:MAG: DUF5615 family PIN-like protein [Candidatus Bipolaricaulota bacterium]|nr:DUF5615 family PIN-like protein [Candidatus Bipolaricaulota bacterium]MDW8140905.1 DUF5615 family PIN-like protein [Candidatus Bipolaricaulota bacterium]